MKKPTCNLCIDVNGRPTRRRNVPHAQGWILKACRCAGKDTIPGSKR